MSPVPLPAEASVFTGNPVRGTAPCVEFHGSCRFRTGLVHLYAPPHAELVVSPAHVMLSITRFHDEDTRKNMLEWVTGYLADTLSATPCGEYRGQGVIATLGYRSEERRVGKEGRTRGGTCD